MSRSTAPRQSTSIRLGPRSAGITMTPGEFDALPPDRFAPGYRYELIRGVLVVSPFPDAAERGPNDVLGHSFWAYRETHPLGASLDETLPEQTVATTPNRRRADRVVWAGLGRVPDPTQDVPTIVIEFVSARRRDWRRDDEEKRIEYQAAGVREYWIIDRFQRTMTIYRYQPEGVVTIVVREDQTYRTDLLPGFELPLARLLASADRWSRVRRRRDRP